MDIEESLKSAYFSLKANKTRSFLTMLGIIIGVTSVILLMAIGAGLKGYITKQLQGLGADNIIVMPGKLELGQGRASGGPQGAGMAAPKFTLNQINTLARAGNYIVDAMGYTENNGTMRYKGKTHIAQVAGVGPNYVEMLRSNLAEGSFFTISQYNSSKKVAVLGKKVAEDLFPGESPVGKMISISDQRYLVLGTFKSRGGSGQSDVDDQVFIPVTTALRQYDLEYIQAIWVRATSAEAVPKAKEEVKKILLKSLKEDQFSVLDTKSILDTIQNILSVLTAALSGIAAISLVVGGIGIMNIMLVSVTERTKEIGLRKAVGATPNDIKTQFLLESLFLSFVGGGIGILLGAGGAFIINHFVSTTITAWSVILAFGVSAAIGTVFGVAPAIKASKLNPIDALRFE